MTRLLAIVAVILAGLALVVALNQGPADPDARRPGVPVGGPNRPVEPLTRRRTRLPMTGSGASTVGGVWIPDPDYPGDGPLGGECVFLTTRVRVKVSGLPAKTRFPMLTALGWQPRGQGFESPWVHSRRVLLTSSPTFAATVVSHGR